ncbi:MAG: fibronectin type III domain-containing protein [Bryobacteraceae bacterium]
MAFAAISACFAQTGPVILSNDFTPPQGAQPGRGRPDDGPWQKRLMTAVSSDGLVFTRTNQVIADQANVPDFILARNGILYLYYTGGAVGSRENVIAAAVSPDQGKTWFYKYVDISGFSGPNPGDPDVRLLEDGTIRMFFTAGRPGSRFPEIHYADSSDGLRFQYRGSAFAIEGEAVLDSFTVPIGGMWHMYTLSEHPAQLWHGVSLDGESFRPENPASFSISGRPYIVTNEIALEDGRIRFYAFSGGSGGDIRSFVTKDGYAWAPEPGVRLAWDPSSGMERGFVKDAAVVHLADGTYLMVYATLIPLASEAEVTVEPDVTAVVNSAGYGPAVAPGSLITIFGASLAGAAVDVGGRPAPVFYTSPTQINSQVPFEIAPGPAAVRVGNRSFPIQVTPAAPGIFKLQGEDALGAPVRPGDYATLYLTGQGEVTPPVGTGRAAPQSPLARATLPVTVTVGGLAAEVQFAGLAPGFIGLMQLNLRVPSLPAGIHPVTVTIGGATSNQALITVLASAAWPAELKVTPTGEYVHAGRTYSSSSSLLVEWTPAGGVVQHYVVMAEEKQSSTRTVVQAGASRAVLENLKSGTEYAVSARACLNASCTAALQSEPAQGATAEEYWRIQGRGSSYATADRIVPDGNVGAYAFRYGSWAGPSLDGKIQLYYSPSQAEEKGVKIGELVAARADTVQDALAFRGVSGYGLLRVCQPMPAPPGGSPSLPPGCAGSGALVTNLNLFQAVPLAGETDGRVRLFFEAGGSDGRTRILYLDSQDGYIGRDFNSGPATRCDSLADYSSGGGCEPKVAVGVDIDGPDPNPNIRNARQFKIGYPTQQSWAWDMRPGTFMWFTTEWPDRRCSPFNFNAAYAVWTGVKWRVDYGRDECPKLLAGAQAPAVVHLGGGSYKMYFNQHALPNGPTDPQVALKPIRLLYADAVATGDPTVVDFEDWEPLASARQVHYLWPDGGVLSENQESRLDDYVVFAPTVDPRRLILYSNMSEDTSRIPPFIGSAVLVNP